MSRRKRLLMWAVMVSLLIVCLAVLTEYSLRAYKTLTYDGMLYLVTPSPNSVPNARYGWISPPSTTLRKDDACYGKGTVTYNPLGFRAPPLAQLKIADPLICIMGDSTMQAYQIADGKTLPHLLQAALARKYPKVAVFPLAVGGFGTLQEVMLFQDFCKKLGPDLVVWHWAMNDLVNDSYEAERHSVTNNNVRRRPYWESGKIVYRRPYPIHLWDDIDDTMTMRIANTIALKLEAPPSKDLAARFTDEGWSVADGLIASFSRSVAVPKIALVEDDQHRAAQMFQSHGFTVAPYEKIPDDLTCKPRDPHPTAAGHRFLLNALLPVVERALTNPAD